MYNLSNEASTILRDLTAEYLNRQELYEQETNYSLDKLKQNEWTRQIASELYRLNNYAQ